MCARFTRTHVASVWSGTVYCLRCQLTSTSKYFRHHGVLFEHCQYTLESDLLVTYLKVSQRDTVLRVVGLAQEQIPQSEFLCLHFELLDNRNYRVPSRVRISRELCVCYWNCRNAFFLIFGLFQGSIKRLEGTHLNESDEFRECFLRKRTELVLDLFPQRVKPRS